MMADEDAAGDRDEGPRPGPARFEDLATLRATHLEMLARQTSPEGRPVLIDAAEAQDFLRRAQATGAILSDAEERSIAQRVIDYWSADLLTAERGEAMDPETVALAPFAATAPEAAPPLRRETYSPDEARQYIRLTSVARQWRDTQSDAYLLSGDALEAARRFARDPDVAGLIEASDAAERMRERRRSRNQTRVIAYLTLVVVMLAGLSLLAFLGMRNATAARTAAEEQRQLAVEAQLAAERAREAEAAAREIAEEARRQAIDEAAEAAAQAEERLRTAAELQQALELSRTLDASREEQRTAADARLAELEARQRLLDIAIVSLADQLAKRRVGLRDIPTEIRADVIASIGARLRSGDVLISDLAPDVAEAIYGEPGLPQSTASDPAFDRPLAGFEEMPFGPELPVAVLPTLPDALRATAYQQGAPVNYLNFSLVLDAQRRTAIFAAANLDRTQRTVLAAETVYYDLDPRLPEDVQPDPGTYLEDLTRNLRIVKLVGRNDIAWGPDAGDSALVDRLVNVYPNAVAIPASHEAGWEAVSTWVQTDHNPTTSRITILSGPVFQADGSIDAPPTALWKIAVSVESLMQKQSAGPGALIVDAFLVDGPLRGNDGVEKYRTTVAGIAERTGLIFPPEVVAADRGVALLNVTKGDTLAALVPDLDGPAQATRRAVAQRLADSVRADGGGATEQAKVVGALVESLQNVQDQSATGRLNLLFVLSQVPRASWNRPDWLALKAAARRAAMDLEARETAGETRIGDDTRRHLDRLKTALGLDERPSQTVYLQFADLTRDRASGVRSSLAALGWTLPGEERVKTASGLREVRYRPGNAADEAAARLLAADIEALGWPGTQAKPVRAVREGILEIWIGSPRPG